MNAFTNAEELKNAIIDYLGENVNNFPPISEWDVSGIDDMSELFKNRVTTPEQNLKLEGLSNWNVSNVESMNEMFYGCTDLNQPLNDWDVSNVTDMSKMFLGCFVFNQPLDEWDVSSVSEMYRMFLGCFLFNQPLAEWDVSNVIEMSEMFYGCKSFNQNLQHWEVDASEHVINFSKNSGMIKKNLPKFAINENREEMDEEIKEFTKKQEQKELEEVERRKQKQKELEEIEQKRQEQKKRAVEVFHDFEEFVAFFQSQVCPTGGNQLPDGTFNVDEFCRKTNDPLKIEDFTVDAPPGLSLLSIEPSSIYDTSSTPFYTAMKYINTKIGRHKLTFDVKNYMVLLNRLIYYYNIFLLIKGSQLDGFRTSTGIIIYVHGGYVSYDESSIITVERPIENVFICSKASPGCYAFDLGTIALSDIEYPNSTIHVMTDNIEKKGFVNFDQSSFRYDVPDISSSDTARIQSKSRMNDIASPHINMNIFGIEMRHYITPRTDVYINKIYEATFTDTKCYVFDLEELKKFYQNKENNIRRYGRDIFYHPYNILSLPRFQSMFRRYLKRFLTPKPFRFTLKDIMDYCKEKGKPNVFIYDKSCGVIGGVTVDDETEIIPRVTRLVEQGFGRRRSLSAKKSTQKIRRTNKRKTHKKKKSQKNKRSQKKLHK